MTAEWDGGVYDYTAGRGTQDTYDDQGQVLNETTPGDTSATTYVYNPDNSIAQQNNPDGSFVAYTYDADGNTANQTVPLHGYSSDNTKVATTCHRTNPGAASMCLGTDRMPTSC